ncbi:MAG TPA: hypothetical protein VJC20_03380 [Candidatus Paceibacterota bacterium]
MCGIAGILSNGNDVVQDLILAGRAQNHRGKESAGLVVGCGGLYQEQKGMGTVEQVFGRNGAHYLSGDVGLVHVRYSTAGGSLLCAAQPTEGTFQGKQFWLAHNGSLVRWEKCARECQRQGYQFTTGALTDRVASISDSEVIVALISLSSRTTFLEAIQDVLSRVEGTYSLVLLYDDVLYGVRDATGNRPLVIGRGRGITGIFSESATCTVLNIQREDEVKAGTVVEVRKATYPEQCHWRVVGSVPFSASDTEKMTKPCLFEFIYFLRPDTKFHERRVQLVREEMGAELWREHPFKADLTIPVPDSGNAAARGYAQAGSLLFHPNALFRFHYSGGRTFIELHDKRDLGLRIKLTVIPELTEGKSIVVVDDSVVRATALKRVAYILRTEGRAREVHGRIASPPYAHPCFYGIDTYRIAGELVAERQRGDIAAIAKEIGLDSLEYLSLNGCKRSVLRVQGDRLSLDNFCDACFSGNYHIPVK